MKTLHRLAATRIFGTPLLMEPRKLDVILHVLAPRLDIEAPTVDASMLAERSDGREYAVVNGVAVIDVCGSLVNRIDANPYSGMRSYEEIGNEVEDAATDPGVRGIVLRFDSYGGEVSGAFDLADMIASAAKLKRVVACVDDNAYSAAYLLASACSEVWITQTGGVGSIGVIAMHVDQSQYDAKVGVRYTAIYAGDRKADFNPHAPLADSAREVLQAEINAHYQRFCQAVASRRGLAVDAVKATQAGLFAGQVAVDLGLADKIGTYRDVMASFAGATPKAVSGGMRRSMSADDSEQPETPEIPEIPEIPEGEDDATAPCMPEEDSSRTASAVAEIPKEGRMSEQTNPSTNQDAVEIVALCAIAGRKDLVADFITAGAKPADVRKQLMELAEKAEPSVSSLNSRGAGRSALSKIESAAAAYKKPGVTKEQAVASALKENPELYDQYLAANPAQSMTTTEALSLVMGGAR